MRIGAATVDRVEEQQVAIPLAILTEDDELVFVPGGADAG